jgi:hypothetical protein
MILVCPSVSSKGRGKSPRPIALEHRKYLPSICMQVPIGSSDQDGNKPASESTSDASQVGQSVQGLSPADKGKVTPLEKSRQVVLESSE